MDNVENAETIIIELGIDDEATVRSGNSDVLGWLRGHFTGSQSKLDVAHVLISSREFRDALLKAMEWRVLHNATVLASNSFLLAVVETVEFVDLNN